MLFRVFMLLSLYAVTVHGQDFVCGYGLDGAGVTGLSSHAGNYRSSTAADPIKLLILFGKFAGEADERNLNTYKFSDRDGNTTRRSTQLVDSTAVGSLAHYFKEMSYGRLHLASTNVDILKKWYEGTSKPTWGPGSGCTLSAWSAAVRAFTRAVLNSADADSDINFADADMVVVFTPPGIGNKACRYDGTVLESPGFSWTASDGTVVDKVITSDWNNRFPFMVGVLAHEYGHAMGLPELYDRTHIRSTSQDSTGVAGYPFQSAGIGYWGVMGRGGEGYMRVEGIADGPAPLSAWSRAEVGWLDSKVETVSSDTTVTIPDINSDNGKVYKIEVPSRSDEYFLLSNRQSGTGSYYDDFLPRSGLLIWHIDDSIVRVNGSTSDINQNEKHKRVDVECADGLFTDKGFPSNKPDSTVGGDNLDYWSADSTYTADHNGNIGDSTDVWVPGKEFTPYSNPSTAGYNGNIQDVFTGIAVRNIRQTNGVVSVDIRFIPSAPTDLTATATVAKQVNLSWSEPASNGATITDYEYSDGSLDEDENELWSELDWTKNNDNDTITATIEDLSGRIYTFKVRAVTTNNEKGQAASATVDLLSQRIEGAAKPSVNEVTDPNATDPVAVGVYRNTDPNPNAPVWSLIGADASSFTLVQTSGNAGHERTLQFREPPNYEVPLAGGGYKTTYDVGVVVRDVPLSGAAGASDGAVSDTLLVTVSVVNVEEAGSVALSPQPPQVGVPLVARLTDPDEGLTFTGASWAWHRWASDTASWQPVSVPAGATGATTNYPELSSYTPPASDVGYYLRASVHYTDNHGPNKRAEGFTSAAVFGPPAASVTAGWGRIRVEWPAVASATSYDVQGQSKPFDRGPWPAAWSSLATNITALRYAHRGVSPDSLYRYQVRSRAGASVSGWSALVPDAAGVQPGVGAPTGFRAAAGAGQVTLRWTGPDHASITQWQYRDVTAAGADTRGGWQDAAVSGSASTEWLATVDNLTPGQAYQFQVRAVNGAGDGQPSAVSDAVTPRAPVCSLTGATAPTFAENALGAVGTYTASAGCGSALSWKLGGTDARFFRLKEEGTSRPLEFKDPPPNFEQPADAGKNNTYAVSVSIGDVSVSVTVSVTDANDAGVVSLSTTAPRAEESLTATLSDEDGIAEPVYWTPHYEGASDGGGVTGPASEATQTWTLTIPSSRVGQSLRLQADYTDSFGAASATSALTSPVRPASNRAPSVSGPASVDIAENSLAPWLLGTYIGRDPDGDDLTWSVTGTDASAFELKEPASPGAEPSRELHLANAADYEAQARYDVWVKVSDAVLSDSLRVSVSVVNQNEDGEVVLTGGCRRKWVGGWWRG